MVERKDTEIIFVLSNLKSEQTNIVFINYQNFKEFFITFYIR